MGLIGNVQVDGVWYGPAYGSTEIGKGIPEDVAGKIGAHCWAPGTAPKPKPKAEGEVEVKVEGNPDVEALTAAAKNAGSGGRRRTKDS